jgi:hypothetical protein
MSAEIAAEAPQAPAHRRSRQKPRFLPAVEFDVR